MKIEIWSDVVCPWCYIGKRRIENALAGFAHADEVEVRWRSYQLDPGAPTEPTESTSVMLARKYGQSPEGAQQMQDRVEAVAAEDGLIYRLSETLHLNTVDAHRLIHLAHQQGGNALQGRVKEALLKAYFTEARNVADHAVLREVAAAAGLDATRVDEVLGSREFEADVHADAEQARAYGATGVPFFVIDQKYGVSGAQPTEAFTQVLERAWADAHPSIEMVGAGEECGPDGCAI
ncbi:Predicted dithiol-disulfide isomerase, DsbA family [Nocardioides alpinus]|uniref:DsbA family oxidoreductase n=1 Tax=Nocardioides alpinus TaxID=748909 RepID=A0A1I0XGE5_9ACTN|nr:DsbA family oxidoreductase [Nocardioides alpinus]PKH44301.1 DsbA family oxidoreductase [Nocardioides alpinus]SFA99318.1 Predicted dithiol-disulfide isomerase, DsbA family [Nocardioides alpinus]